MGAGALGIGDIRLHSALNQSLDAEIPLALSSADSLSDIKVSLAGPEDFAKAGIERHYYLSKLQFRAVQSPGGYVIKVSSRDAIREPFISFLVEVNWPQGRMLREFTMLLDPPSTMPEETMAETAPYQVERPIRQYERVAEISRSGEAAPPGRRSARRSVATAPRQAVAPSVPIPPPSADQLTSETYGPVRRNETLWSIAKSISSDPSLTHEQMVMALFRANPQAFSGSINGLKAGSTLRIPTREFIAQLNPQQAQAEFSRQQGMSSGRLVANRGPEPGAEAEGEAPQGQLKLLAPSDSKTKGQNAVAGDETSGSRGKGDLALEVAETAKQENEELRSRLTQLEQKLAAMQRVLTLKDEQLASLKAPEQPATAPSKPAPQSEQPAARPVPAQQSAPAPTPSQPAVQAPKPLSQPETAKPSESASPATTTQATPSTTTTQATPSATPAQATPPATPAQTTAPAQATPPAAPSQTIPSATSSQTTPPAVPKQSVSPSQPRPKPAAPPAAHPAAKADDSGLPVDPTYLGVGAAVLGLVAWLLKRRRNAMIAETESILLAAERESLQSAQASASKATEPAFEPMVPSKTSFLSEFTPSDFDALAADTDEVDAISEADVYLAYGRYKQAEDLIRHSIAQHPERDDYKLKLLEIYYATENRSAFENYALELKAQRKDAQRDLWAKVEEMGRELVPTSSLFQASPASRQEKTAKRSSNTAKSLASLDLSDDLIEDLKRFEIEIAEPVPSSYGESDVIPLEFGAAEEKAAAPAEKPREENQRAPLAAESRFGQAAPAEKPSEANQRAPAVAESRIGQVAPDEKPNEANHHAPLDFDIASLDFTRSSEDSENKPPVEEETPEIPENLIPFDLAEAPAAVQEEPSPIPSDEETLEDILSSLTGSVTQEETGNKLANPDQNLGGSESALSLFEPGSGLELEEESYTESELNDAAMDPYAESADIDQIETKLDLARAYADMEDEDSASEILYEVLANGNEKQQAEAKILLDKMGRTGQPEFSMTGSRAGNM
jgi:pilus assembly protein FimV